MRSNAETFIYGSQSSLVIDVKVEPVHHPASVLLSCPSSPLCSRSCPDCSPRRASRRAHSATSDLRLGGSPPSSYSFDRPESGLNMDQSPYSSWAVEVKNERATEHSGIQRSGSRHSTGSDQDVASMSYPGFMPDGSFSPNTRQASGSHIPTSMSSSLSGAMGDTHISIPLHNSSSASPPNLPWVSTSMVDDPSTYVVMPSSAPMPPYLATPETPLELTGSPGTTFLPYSDCNIVPGYPNTDVSTLPSSSYPDHYFQQPQDQLTQNAMFASSSSMIPMNHSPVHISRSRRSMQGSPDDELNYLRNRVHELELVNESARQRIRELEHEVSRTSYNAPSTSSSNSLPSPITPLSHTSFRDDWRARTEARTKMFCSLNRAGNALCAWHDSRRERRAYPPRMAPPSTLNCGCTYEEALFEESLARHGVGSYHPGENVRMDPALRNPLLRLLKRRYGYRDGDFERDPATGTWIEGEGAAHWEARLAGGSSSRRTRG